MTAPFWAVTTCPRPGLPRGYLPGFLEGWDRDMKARFNLHVFHDRARELGAAENFRRLLVEGVASRAPLIHAFQDDARPCLHAFARIASHAIPRWASFATWHAHTRGVARQRPGWNKLPIADFCGFPAITIRRAAAIDILKHLKKTPWPHKHLADEIPRVVFKDRKVFVAQHVPDLFEHVGAVSVCHPGAECKGARSSATFIGEDFDAASLGVFR